MVDGKKVGVYISAGLIAIIFLLAFLTLRPILLSIITGLILAYVLYPVYKRFLSFIRDKNITSLIICILLVLLFVVPAWFLAPTVIQQIFQAYTFLQKANLGSLVSNIFPSANLSPDFYSSLSNFIGTVATSLLKSSTSFILNFQTILLNLAVVFFVLFFALRDIEELKSYIKSLSPLSSETEDIFFNKFKDVTNSVLFGQIIVGIIQGVTAGLGYFIFGIPNILSLTLLSVFFGVIPFIGPAIVWLPVVLVLFVQGKTGTAIGLLIYGILIVSTIDNITRPVIVSKRTKINSGIVFVGMVGGMFVFGILGLILGPLILAYTLIILDLYRNKKL